MNRRLEIPPDVIPGEKTAIPSPSPAPSHPARTALGRVVPRPQHCDLPTLCAVCSSRGAGGYEGEGSWGGSLGRGASGSWLKVFLKESGPWSAVVGGLCGGTDSRAVGCGESARGSVGIAPAHNQPRFQGCPEGFRQSLLLESRRRPEAGPAAPAAPSPGQCQAAAGRTRTPVCGSRVGGQRGPPLTACVCREPQAAVGAAWPGGLSCCQPSCLRRSCVLLGTAAPPSTG